MIKKFALFTATGFYTGYIPVAPGTAGSLVGVGIYYCTSFLLLPVQLVLLAVYMWIAYGATKQTIGHFGVDDPPQIVCDEVAGMWLVLAGFNLPIAGIALAFVLFRIFDILKPFPVGIIDRNIKGAAGVMLDDIAAGLIAKAIVWILMVR